MFLVILLFLTPDRTGQGEQDRDGELREDAARRENVVMGKPVKPAALRALMSRMLSQRATVRREAS